MQHSVRLASCLCLLAAACGGSPAMKPPGDGGLPPQDAPADGLPPQDASSDIMATVVGAAGGTLSSNAVVVHVPAGALTDDVSVAVSRLGATSIAALPAASAPGIEGVAQLSSEVFAFTPHGTTFTMPVEIEIAYAGQANVVLRLDDEQDTSWEFVPGATFEAGKARFQVRGFSVYSVASATPVCGLGFCAALPAEVKCGVVRDACNNLIDVGASCGRSCAGDTRCFFITDSFSPGGGYNGCRLPCGSCPPDSSTCIDGLFHEVTVSSCAPGGYCDGFIGRTRCGSYDEFPDVNCRNGRCEPQL